MLITADWVVPVCGPPIRHGALYIHQARISEIGRSAELAGRHPRAPRHDFPDCVLLPGLVNAHTHLSLTALDGLLPPMRFHDWLRLVVPAIKSLDDADFSASAALGATRCLQAGITVVGDIVFGPEAPAASADMGVGGMFFWEVLGISRSELPEALAEKEFPLDPAACSGRQRCGLSPHSAYSSGPDLLSAVFYAASVADVGFAIHVAESPAESRLMARGEGPLEPVARRLAFGFRPPRLSTVAYLERLGVLAGATAVHCVNLAAGDPDKLARRTRGVVLCPRSNAHLYNGQAPVSDLDHAGCCLGLGTDSLASSPDFDLFAEARALRSLSPSIGPRRMIEIMTREGARALGVDDAFGRLEAGAQADLVVVHTGPTEKPEATVLAEGSTKTVRAVASGGLWRILDGKPVFPTGALEKPAACAADKARAAIKGMSAPA